MQNSQESSDGPGVKKLGGMVAALLIAMAAYSQPPLRLKAGHARPDSRRAAGPQNSRTPGRSHWIVQFQSAPTLTQLSELGRRGARVLSYVPDYGLSVVANDDTAWDGLEAEWVGRLAPEEKISPEFRAAHPEDVFSVVAEFYFDVDLNVVREIASGLGFQIQENPDLVANHVLLRGNFDQMLVLARWDEIAYIFPASEDLAAGIPVHGCMGALTNFGPVGQSIEMIDDGWDGPGKGSASLNYSFIKLTDKLPSGAGEGEISRALAEWAKYVQLTFTANTNAAGPRTLGVLFASRAHGDGYPFDGPGRVLAHTFYPVPTNPESIAGDIHLDNDETWKIGADVDVFSIALHEAGHALGLGHSDNPGAVMYPYYRMHAALAPEDIAAIRQIYATRDDSQPASPTAPPSPAPPSDPPAPLLLAVQAPPASTTAATVTLTGTLFGGTGPVTLSWTSNQGFYGTAQASSPWVISAIPLNIGTNGITISARDSMQNAATQSVTITRQQVASPPSPPSQPPAPPSPPTPGGPDTTAPSLTILSPANTTVATSEKSIVVSGMASDNTGVTRVTWSSSTGGSGTASGTTNWATPSIPLYLGTTTIVIRAADAAGNTSWRSLVVTRN